MYIIALCKYKNRDRDLNIYIYIYIGTAFVSYYVYVIACIIFYSYLGLDYWWIISILIFNFKDDRVYICIRYIVGVGSL